MSFCVGGRSSGNAKTVDAVKRTMEATRYFIVNE